LNISASILSKRSHDGYIYYNEYTIHEIFFLLFINAIQEAFSFRFVDQTPDYFNISIEGGIGVTGRRGRSRKQVLDDCKNERILEIERGSTRSNCVKNWLWKRLRTCVKTNYRMNG
jgi:hypothetical protein